ncbi:MAG: folylpolyglutamate synthase/dihydrofolate synthase family protein [Candidatus Nanohaloarchaea archaeon]
MNYEKAVEDLRSRGSGKKEPALEGTREALDLLGEPQQDYRVVLVGGSNGKGSTVEMVSEGLQAEGLDVGVYKSPHLTSVRERIRVNSEDIGREEFADRYHETRKIDNGAELTFFETLTVMAFQHFSRERVDIAVMEVGMGGRLDATNAADPEIAAITNIAEEHTEYLGDTREEIAREKAGIIPEDGKLVARDQLEPVLETAAERDTEVLGPLEVERIGDRYILDGHEFSLPVEGSFQQDNLETALRVIDELTGLPEELEGAFSGLRCPGRMETVSRRPTCIHDGAHNPAALRRILPDLPEDFTCVFAALETKDIEEMVSVLEQKASKFYLTQPDFFRAASPEEIAEKVSKPYSIVNEPRKAVDCAKQDAGENGTVVVTGSLYLIGDARRPGEDDA